MREAKRKEEEFQRLNKSIKEQEQALAHRRQ